MKITHHTLATPAYGNCTMLGPDDTVLCKCDLKRANWYISRDLAEIITDKPLVFKLNFIPNGMGCANDEYSLAVKENRCVVCGRYDHLTKHHIVPAMYRRHLSIDIKSRSSHDVVVICLKHHYEYEEEATKLKNEIHKSLTGEIITQHMSAEAHDEVRIARYCRTLYHNRAVIPANRVKEMYDEISELSGKEATAEVIADIYHSFDYSKPFQHAAGDPGKMAVDNLKSQEDIQQFVETWRRHFIETAKPKYMVAHWDIEREVIVK